MADYISTGGIRLGGCAKAAKAICISYKYAEGSTVYFCQKARCGCLEKVTIKRVRLVTKWGQYIPLYISTLNALYNEDELCTHAEAVELAIAFYESQVTLATETALRCS